MTKKHHEFNKKHGKLSRWIIRKIKNSLTNKDFIKNLLRKALFIKTTTKASGILYVLSFAIAIGLYKINLPSNNFVRMVNLLLAIIIILGLGKFFGFKLNAGFFDEFYIYSLKLSIFLLFSLSFILEFLKEINNTRLLFIALGITLFFSVYLLKGIIDGFNSTIFFITNFIFIYLYNLAMIGLGFGYYYLAKNQTYVLFENPQAYNSFDPVTILSIIFKGLTYFYSVPASSFTNDFEHLVPFIEYIFGSVVNIGIIGFFLSYIASKVYANKTFNEQGNKSK